MQDGGMQRPNLADASPRALFAGGLAMASVLAAGHCASEIAARIRGGPPAGVERVQVIDVVDGDTLVVEGGRSIRILGIDTPETRHPAMRGPQPMGQEATEGLAALVAGRRIALERDVTDRDHYGRELRHVWRGRGLVAETLLAKGLARSLILPPNRAHAERLERAEARARAEGLGIWGLPRPTALPIFDTPMAGDR